MNPQKLYYFCKPAIPRCMQISLRRSLVGRQLPQYSEVWPINPQFYQKPDGWPGWPEGKKFGLVLTHDVDTAEGQTRCIKLKNLEEKLGFRSSFNFVPERYAVSSEVLNCLRSSGFEIGVHGLNHDGKLYDSKDVFAERAVRINHYLKEWGAVGFRSPAMHHNLDWMHDLNIKYDSSTFDTDPFEPQPDGVGTIFPFFVKSGHGGGGYFELPYTLAQDFTLFILMKNKGINIWQKKLDWIVEHGGMALINTHPDYMNFGGEINKSHHYPSKYYKEFLEYIKQQYADFMWQALPHQVANYFRSCNFTN